MSPRRVTPSDLDDSTLDGLVWRSSNGGQVEVAPFTDGSGRVALRHSEHPDASVIVYTKGEWDAFLAGARDGEFDF